MTARRPWIALGTIALIVLVAALAVSLNRPESVVIDEAKAAGRTVAQFPEANQDYFSAMDGGVQLSADAIKGRDTWMVWSAGDDAFWDYLSTYTLGTVDLLKTISSHPALPWRGRSERFRYLGLVNEPGFVQATAADPQRHGLWLDRAVGPPDPFEDAVKYPGVNGGSFYGWPTGVIGLRLFPNPAFTGAAKTRWNAERYYRDPGYYRDPTLVRPYRVGMTCAFCHAGFNPERPAADPERPAWGNLSSYVGAQYLRFGRVFYSGNAPNDFLWQLVNAAEPGTTDTSLLSSDGLDNPRTMNAIYNVAARLHAAQRWGKEQLAGGALGQDQLSVTGGIVSFLRPDTVYAPHVLKDGADSAGILAALDRVYVSIGEFHQEWVRHFRLLAGGDQTPFPIALAQRNSIYWQATAERTPHVALFFLEAARPHRLADAPGGARYLTKDAALLRRGQLVFAENCMMCHSSKQPPDSIVDGTPAASAWRRREVVAPAFLANNFLSTDRRYPVSFIGTNACSPLASNAIRGHVWDNFSSETYKQLPGAGPLVVPNPVDGAQIYWTPPAGGRGYVRVPSLVSIWSTAPFFQNNSLGPFTGDPSVAGRMAAFNGSIAQLLWPARRVARVRQTTATSYLNVPRRYLPPELAPFLPETVRIGPIPAGTPIDALANVDVSVLSRGALLRLLIAPHTAASMQALVPTLLRASACPDLVLNHGHPFGTTLGDADKLALIEFLKTF